MVYAQACEIVERPSLVDTMNRIGVFKVNIGLEAGSDQTLKHMKGERDSVEVNYKALEILKANDIATYGSFVLGTDAETPATMAETIGWIRKIVELDLISDVEMQPILPLLNNYYGKNQTNRTCFP